jgi:hypothetical protein
MRYLWCLCVAVTLSLQWFVHTPAAPAQAKKMFRAGAHAQNINPQKYPISVNGGMTDRQAKGAHDPMHARCLVLDDGTNKLAFVVVDACMVPRDITDAAKALAQKSTGIPPERILISATHTHTAPTLAGVFQSEPDDGYREYLKKQIGKGIEQAVANLEPAKVGWGVGQDPTQVFNRRWLRDLTVIPADPFGNRTDKVQMNPGYQAPGLVKPAGPTDPAVSLLSVQSMQGRPIAILANYSLHYVGDVPGNVLSADYFGAFAERIKELVGAEKTDPPFVGIMSNGTSGDINNVNYGGTAPEKKPTFERTRYVADSVAQAAFKAYKKIQYQHWVSLDSAQAELELGVRLPSEKDVQAAKEILAKAKGAVLTKREEIYARETVLLAKYPPRVKLLVQAHRVGSVGIAAIPCEVFVEIGLELKKKSPLQPTFTIELANGYNGYLPTPEQHKLGGYETWRARSSYLEPNASVVITDTLLKLFDQVVRSN